MFTIQILGQTHGIFYIDYDYYIILLLFIINITTSTINYTNYHIICYGIRKVHFIFENYHTQIFCKENYARCIR